MEGHQDWIRCLTFTSCDNGSLFLASASQDNKIRLWAIAPVFENSELGALDKKNLGKGLFLLSPELLLKI